MNDELKFTVISDTHYYSKKNFADGFDKNKKPHIKSATGNEPIDFIFTDGKAVDYTVLNDLNNGYVSDHYGVYSGINF